MQWGALLCNGTNSCWSTRQAGTPTPHALIALVLHVVYTETEALWGIVSHSNTTLQMPRVWYLDRYIHTHWTNNQQI